MKKNVGMEDVVVYGVGEVVGKRGEKDRLGEWGNVGGGNESVDVGIDRCREMVRIDGNGVGVLEEVGKRVG